MLKVFEFLDFLPEIWDGQFHCPGEYFCLFGINQLFRSPGDFVFQVLNVIWL